MTYINTSALFLVSILVATLSSSVSAFVAQQQPITQPKIILHASNDNNNSDNNERRNFLNQSAGVAMSVLLGGTSLCPKPAVASYTSFTRREDDWKQRSDKGEINISSARDLRSQLREIAPMNNEGSKLFCPNGESSAVSPLMENKCGDRMAMPSVYGRSDDAMGNSVPGFGIGTASAATLRDELNAQAYFRDSY